MSVERICRLRDYGIFRNFTWPDDLPEFGRYNLVYGWNGSGKTLLSQLFHDLGQKRPPSVGQARVRIDGRDVDEHAFSQVTVPIRVFNRDFVWESVFPASGADLPPVFVIGKESVDKQKEADRLKVERANAESTHTAAVTKRQNAESTLDQFCQQRARAIKEKLRSPDQHQYNNYDKSDFRQRVMKMVADDDAALHRLSDKDREDCNKQRESQQKPKVSEVTYRLPPIQALAEETGDLLSTTVVSKAIQALKDDAELAEWTRRGFGLHRDRSANQCLFCEQVLPPGRLAALEAHFSAEYEQFLSMLDKKVEELEVASRRASELRLPNYAEFYPDLEQEYTEAEQHLRQAVDTVQGFLGALVDVLNAKRARPFARLVLDVETPEVAADFVGLLNEVVRKHNLACDAFRTRIAGARDRLALDMIADSVEEFARLSEEIQQAREAVSAASGQVRGLTEEIKRLEREILQHQRPAEELNEDLRHYLGHGELQLSINDTGYSITRNGERAEMLSEGEMTAIALLYFLKSLEDSDFDFGRGVVVLDDPVSSMDQNSIFAAFGYIRARVQGASQVVILTHNFMFFRLVLQWFRHLRGADKRAWQVYMLECDLDDSRRTAKIRVIDRLLKDFDSEYHYLFARLHRMATAPPEKTLEDYYCAPSIARRIVEMFLAFRFPNVGVDNSLWSRIDAVKCDEAVKSRVYRYMQSHAHRNAVGDADEDLTLLGESRGALRDVLAFMRAADPDHVARMIDRVSPVAAATGGAAGI